jgi:hypothetical protein
MTQVSKAEAKYQAEADECESCTGFLPPHGCKRVAGKIDPDGWCRLYHPVPETIARPRQRKT